jgi:glutaredoxin
VTYHLRAPSQSPTAAPIVEGYANRDRSMEPEPTAVATVRGPSPSSDPNGDARLRWLQTAAQGAGGPTATATARIAPTAAEDAPAPIVTARRALSIAGVPVVVYTTNWCPVCKQAKAWMRRNGVAYEERDIETSSEYARKMKLLNPRGSIPTIDVDGAVMVGFSETAMVSMLERAAQKRSEDGRL